MFSNKFSIFFIFFGFFFSILGGNAEASGKIVNLSEKDFGNFNVLNVKINKQHGETESKKIVFVNIDNLNLTVDSTRGGVWIYLKSQTNNGNNNHQIPKMSVDPSSKKVHTLETKTLSSFDILNITLYSGITSPESKKKINVLINDIGVVLDTRNNVVLSLKSTKSINNNNNNDNSHITINGNVLSINSNNDNVFVSSNNINDIDINFHWDGTAFSTAISSIGNFDSKEFNKDMDEMREDMKMMQENMKRDELFDRKAFNKDMNEMQEDMKEMRENMEKNKIFDREAFDKDMNEMRENMRGSIKSHKEEFRNNMDQMREDMQKMRINMRENFPWYRQWN